MTADDGPDGAFTRLVVEHQSALYTLARRLTTRLGDAEDLVAESLLKVWRAMGAGRVPEGDGLRPWLVTVLLNEHRNRLRASGRRPDERASDEVPEPRPGSGQAPAAEPERSVERLALERALDGLPERQRIAVVLRHVIGFTSDEVAASLGCPASTARSLCRRGLATLREELGDES